MARGDTRGRSSSACGGQSRRCSLLGATSWAPASPNLLWQRWLVRRVEDGGQCWTSPAVGLRITLECSRRAGMGRDSQRRSSRLDLGVWLQASVFGLCRWPAADSYVMRRFVSLRLSGTLPRDGHLRNSLCVPLDMVRVPTPSVFVTQRSGTDADAPAAGSRFGGRQRTLRRSTSEGPTPAASANSRSQLREMCLAGRSRWA